MNQPIVYWQNDPKWGFEDVGESTEDLGNVGCLVTSLTMAYNWLMKPEIPLTPKDMNDWLKENPDAFIGANMVVAKAAEHVGLSAPEKARTRGKPGDPRLVEALKEALATSTFTGTPKGVAILHVSKDGGPKGHHFVLARVLDDGFVAVDDPALGRTIDMPLSTLSVNVYWRKALKKYAVVSVIPVSLP